jgi:succinate-acetate transporter protein
VKASATAVGYYLVGWTIVTGILMLCSFRTNVATALVFIALFVTFLLLAIGALTGGSNGTNITHLGGWVGVITAIVAWYTALAGVMSGVSGGKINLPTIPLS